MTKGELETENLKLKNQIKALEDTVTGLLKEIERLRDAGIGEVDPNLPIEEQIINKQINYFLAISSQGPLTIDETRALDLLFKNKRTLEDKKAKSQKEEVPDDIPVADLLRIVSNGEEKPIRKRKTSKTSKKDPVEKRRS